ncbi:hypothetical protein OFN97_00760 [Campylobacter sp. VBCF_05 NA6]|nr:MULTISPECIES: hypothetical protein [unclassified Campylobacter]MDA3057649.1 hypothetical protein [Campylobacter sp. VBCF_04 NA7]MDA3058550.1 hypothetical protein [Campylobacter sp. VBCF_05 NA6]
MKIKFFFGLKIFFIAFFSLFLSSCASVNFFQSSATNAKSHENSAVRKAEIIQQCKTSPTPEIQRECFNGVRENIDVYLAQIDKCRALTDSESQKDCLARLNAMIDVRRNTFNKAFYEEDIPYKALTLQTECDLFGTECLMAALFMDRTKLLAGYNDGEKSKKMEEIITNYWLKGCENENLDKNLCKKQKTFLQRKDYFLKYNQQLEQKLIAKLKKMEQENIKKAEQERLALQKRAEEQRVMEADNQCLALNETSVAGAVAAK